MHSELEIKLTEVTLNCVYSWWKYCCAMSTVSLLDYMKEFNNVLNIGKNSSFDDILFAMVDDSK